MQGVKRKLVYVSLYEVIGMTFSALGLALLSGTSPGSTGPLAVIITTIAVMSEGKLQQVGSPTDIYDRPANRFVAQFVGIADIQQGRAGAPARAADIDTALALVHNSTWLWLLGTPLASVLAHA